MLRLLGTLHREPVLFLSLGYALVSVLGLWSSYWFYRRFGIPILEYLQISDVFFAGLRRPTYLMMLLLSIAGMWLSTWPQRINERDPERAARIRARWWGGWVFPASDSWMHFWGARSESQLVLGSALLAMYMLFVINRNDAQAIHEGRGGDRVEVRLMGQTASLPEARLLGTSSAFVYLWWPETRRAEVIPVSSVARIAMRPEPVVRTPPPAAASATPVPPASPAPTQ
ncbi:MULTISPECIES: hypothetical protein [Luteimonas]|uniref:hypothetical protein n=1 Tax=Luteimonas TaxID=83614 RepID=UPI000C79F0EC|nr:MULTISPECIES: hypothetical protein [Luteimonas]